MPTGQKNRPSLHSPSRKLIRSSCSLPCSSPITPLIPPRARLNQIIQTQLSAAEQKIDLKLADPATGQYKPIFGSSASQNRQYTGSSQTDSGAAANIAASFANEDFRKSIMREALVLSLPTDQRTVFLRVVLLDENGNVSSFSNTLPVTVGKKKIQLQSPWSGWQEDRAGHPPHPDGRVYPGPGRGVLQWQNIPGRPFGWQDLVGSTGPLRLILRLDRDPRGQDNAPGDCNCVLYPG